MNRRIACIIGVSGDSAIGTGQEEGGATGTYPGGDFPSRCCCMILERGDAFVDIGLWKRRLVFCFRFP